MKIGIFMHSFTGNTESVVIKLKERLLADGHSVQIERIRAVGETRQTFSGFRLESIPDSSVFDGLVIAAPIRAFSLSPVMTAYLEQMPAVSGKPTGLFVTEAFPFQWMGGKQGMAKMSSLSSSKGAKIGWTGIINWSNSSRGKMIAETIGKISGLFSGK